MGVVAKDSGGSGFEAPPTGLYPAKCIDVVDLGEKETPYIDERTKAKKWQHQIMLVFQLHVEDEDGNVVLRTDGKPFRLGAFYNLSLNEKANLRKDLDNWRGKPFTEEELAEGFDVEKLLGVPCQVNVQVDNSGPKAKARITGIMKANRRDPEINIDPEFIREKDRAGGRDVRSPKSDGNKTGDDWSGKGGSESKGVGGSPFDGDDDDDLPF